MAGTAAAVRDNGARLLHHRFPVGVGHVGDKHITLLHAVHFAGVSNDSHRARTDLLTDGAAFGKDLAAALQSKFLLHVGGVLTALHGLRPRLQNVDLAVDAVFTPFNIHGTAVVLFNDAGKFRKFNDVVVCERKAAAVFGFHVNRANRAPGGFFRIKLHLDELTAQSAAHDRVLARGKARLMHEEFVGVHGPLNDGFTQAVARGHKNDLIKAAFGVKRKHDACGTFIRAAHSLHARGKRHFHVGKALVDAVADRAVVIKRREHFLHAGKDLIDPDHVEVRFLLAGKGGVREVFSGCRRAHRHGNFVLAVFEPLVKRADFLFEFRRKSRDFFCSTLAQH